MRSFFSSINQHRVTRFAQGLRGRFSSREEHRLERRRAVAIDRESSLGGFAVSSAVEVRRADVSSARHEKLVSTVIVIVVSADLFELKVVRCNSLGRSAVSRRLVKITQRDETSRY